MTKFERTTIYNQVVSACYRYTIKQCENVNKLGDVDLGTPIIVFKKELEEIFNQIPVED
jgi:hypothetical protein